MNLVFEISIGKRMANKILSRWPKYVSRADLEDKIAIKDIEWLRIDIPVASLPNFVADMADCGVSLGYELGINQQR